MILTHFILMSESKHRLEVKVSKTKLCGDTQLRALKKKAKRCAALQEAAECIQRCQLNMTSHTHEFKNIIGI